MSEECAGGARQTPVLERWLCPNYTSAWIVAVTRKCRMIMSLEFEADDAGQSFAAHSIVRFAFRAHMLFSVLHGFSQLQFHKAPAVHPQVVTQLAADSSLHPTEGASFSPIKSRNGPSNIIWALCVHGGTGMNAYRDWKASNGSSESGSAMVLCTQSSVLVARVAAHSCFRR